ncbi:MAG: bifunctional oligoribonuclease/PAP phosphatase NrnA [Rhodothermales bacterium]|nr:bifunctional oligoribonuclease/PAP phosphatase NrnA [Rhodothermales bacterium]
MNPFIEHLLSHDSFVIITHLKPDGDAIGSQLALGLFLEKQGKRVAMMNTDDVSPNLQWLPQSDRVTIFDGSMVQREAISGADCIVIVDTNSQNRLGGLGDAVLNSPAVKLLVDHHPGPEKWFDAKYVRESASSTGELVYEIISAIDPDSIDSEIATALYTAIMTDTGSFRYSHVNATVHRAVADIIERGGVKPESVHDAIFDSRSLSGLRLLGRALDSIRLTEDGRLGYLVVTQQMLRDAGADRDDTEGFVNYILSIENVCVALFFFETDSGVKISLRSKAGYRVDQLARAIGGGGHQNASGAFVDGDLQDAVEQALALAPKYLGPTDESTEVSDEEVALLSSLMEEKQRNK